MIEKFSSQRNRVPLVECNLEVTMSKEYVVMKESVQADADLKERIVLAVKRSVPEISFRAATEASLEGLEEPVVLGIAAQEGRVLVSHDRRTMPYHFGEFISNSDSPGLIIVS